MTGRPDCPAPADAARAGAAPDGALPDAAAPHATAIAAAAVPLERDVFVRTLVAELAQTLQEVVGLDEAAGFVSVVGTRIGRAIDADYRRALGRDRLDLHEVAAVLVDLKRRIQGDFRVVEADGTRIVLANTRCPFAEKVVGRPSLCMMTSNVFGRIVADNLGYARVELPETIALGHAGCRVVVHLSPPAGSGEPGREYYRVEEAR